VCGALLIKLRIFQGLSHKDKEDQDLTYKDKDKDLKLVLEEINITAFDPSPRQN